MRNWEEAPLKLAWWEKGMGQSLRDLHLIQEYRWALEDAEVEFCDYTDFDWDFRVYFMEPTLWVTGRGEPQEDLVYHTSCPVDRLPEHWVDVLNRAGLVWVPSEWNRGVFERSGVECRIMVGGYGVNCDEEFAFSEQDLDGPYIFLVVSDFLKDEGNCMEVVKAFVQLDLPDARLVVKTNSGPWKNVNVTKEGKKYDVRVITEQFSRWEMAELFGRVNCLVCPSSGEAFGLTALQAMATGRMVIATDWGALAEIVGSGYCLPIETASLVEAASFNQRHEGSGKWAKIDLDSLCSQMKWAYDNREEAAEMGRSASAYVGKRWTWPTVARKVKETLQSNLD